MDTKVTGLGIVLLLVFWAFQAGYLNSLGTAAWFVAVLIAVVLMALVGKSEMPKPSANQKMLFNFVAAFSLILAAIVSFVPPSILGVTPPSDLNQLTAMLLSVVLVLYGGALFVTGWELRKNMTLFAGIFWLFAAVTFVVNSGANAYLHFGLVLGLSHILYGIFKK